MGLRKEFGVVAAIIFLLLLFFICFVLNEKNMRQCSGNGGEGSTDSEIFWKNKRYRLLPCQINEHPLCYGMLLV